jgi:division protein CdvB (Snf7/Vps24/ESCRT-III family)
VKSIVATVGKQLEHLMPEVTFGLNQINETLDGLVVETGSVADVTMPAGPFSIEAEAILREADVLAEQKMKSRFPELHPTPSAELTPSS